MVPFFRNSIKFCWLIIVFYCIATACSNKINTWASRQYHMATTRWNIYFNGKESLLKGEKQIREAYNEDFDKLLPLYFENNIDARKVANSDMSRSINKAVKAIELHSITAKPKRKKGKRNSKSYREFRRKKEYNNMIDDCYLLLGKAQFYRREYYSTERTFRYILREYKDLPVYYEASIWYARTLGEQDKYFRALRTIDDVMKEKKFPEKLAPLARKAKADIFIRREKYNKACEELEYLTKHTKKSDGQSRYYYLLAQLYTKQNKIDKAQASYEKLIATNPEYEYEFHSKLSKALLYGRYSMSPNNNKIVSELKILLADRRNKEYLDQVYYTLGKVYEQQGNTSKAEENYLLSDEYNIGDKKQAAKTLLSLGDLYFGKKKDYSKALENYSKAKSLITKNYPQYEKISVRLKSLTKLAKNLQIVNHQDSLYKVAKMSDLEREQHINSLILKENELTIAKNRKAKRKALIMLKSVARPTGSWYFYNLLAVEQGKKEFKEKWGEIALKDNWRDKQEPISIANIDYETTNDEVLNTRTFADYLKDIPFTSKELKISKNKKIDALYQVGIIYEEEVEDYVEAIKAFERVLSEKTEKSKQKLEANYHLFLLNSLSGNKNKASHYKQRIITQWPNSKYTDLLKDSSHFENIRKMKFDASNLYQKAFQAYSDYKFSVAEKMSLEGANKYKQLPIYQRFLFLNAMSKAYKNDSKAFRESLKMVLANCKDSKILRTTKVILAQLNKGILPQKPGRIKTIWKEADFDKEIEEDTKKEIENQHIVEIPKAYTLQSAQKHYFALILPSDIKGQIGNKIEKFNKASFSKELLKTNRKKLDLNRDIIIVEAFKNKSNAFNYLTAIIVEENNIMQGVNKVDYDRFIISDSNLRKLTVDKKLQDYLDFYSDKYLSKDDNTEQDNSNYKYTPKKDHNFLLLIPKKKVDYKYIMRALRKFDKKFKVQKNKFGNQNMIIVRNIGDKEKAMVYLRKVVKVEYIYKNIRKEGIYYRNFIITNNNLKILLNGNNSIDNYITFFKANYLK